MTRKVENSILIPEMAELLREGKEVRFTPTGVSMRPFIEGGKDVVVLRKLPEVRVGDIALAAIPHPAGVSYVLHRVIGVQAGTVTLMGDGNIGHTEQCTIEDVLGTVVLIENAHGRHKHLTRGRLWYHLRPFRRIILKIYRKLLKWQVLK